MLVYQNTVAGFLADVDDNMIDSKVQAKVRERLNMGVSDSELTSWGNSLVRVAAPLRRSTVPEDAGVSIECQLPMSSKRIDFILSGYNADGEPHVVIIELKQWSEVSVTAQDGLVQTFLGGGIRTTSHPSYQAWSYAEYLHGFNETVELEGIHLQPCAFLHNCTNGTAVLDKRYAVYTEQAPVFLKQNVSDLRGFLEHFVQTGDNGVLMDKIDHGRIRPSKSLADSLVALLKKQREFILLDEQKVAFELAMAAIRKCQANASTPKQVLIVRGGPGTGKSVVAINLLVSALAEGNNAAYVTKNAAPRDVYESKLTGTTGTPPRPVTVPFSRAQVPSWKVLPMRSMHSSSMRPTASTKNRAYANLGENQIKEIIDAARCSVFFLDEDQRIHINDIGSEDEIRRWPRPRAPKSPTSTFPPNSAATAKTATSPSSTTFWASAPAHTSLEDMDYEFEVVDSLWSSTRGSG